MFTEVRKRYGVRIEPVIANGTMTKYRLDDAEDGKEIGTVPLRTTSYPT